MLASCNWFRQWFTLKPKVRTETKMVKRLRLKPHFQSPTWRSCHLLIPDFLVFQLPAIWWVCEFWNISFTRIKKAKFSHYCMSKKWRKKPLSSLKISDLSLPSPTVQEGLQAEGSFRQYWHTFAMEVCPLNATQGQVLEEISVVNWVVTGIWMSPKEHMRLGVTVSVTH